MVNLQQSYEEQVYAGVLGKVIGVYVGRPFEGWAKEKLEARFGLVDRYVHEELHQPLVVSDDDISGTFTFIRALEDSGLYAETTAEAFGDAWLNYVAEGRCVFWWGGAGTSTEHTAFLRLKQGYKAPLSGSIALNGRVVAEQIGAQIFIDSCGLVAPGAPEIAARLAQRAASVSHDGEAVNAAMVVAVMVSAAFTEKSMEALLDLAVQYIPQESLIAQLHRDVRRWCREDGDWTVTYDRIVRQYGPSRFWGGPHVVPNHALMVMAWSYAPEDFQQALAIVNTAGWDTDCNSGNVGAVLGVLLGLEGINKQYPFQAPCADRIVIPTAEGTRGVSDCLLEAQYLARLGRRVMGWPTLDAPKGGAWHHFQMPGALHGYLSEDDTFLTRGAARVANVETAPGTRALQINYADVSAGRPARVSTPILAIANKDGGPYALMGTPRPYPGMRVTLVGRAGEVEGLARARLFARYGAPEGSEARMAYSDACMDPFAYDLYLASGQPFALYLDLPEQDGLPVQALGLEITGTNRACGELLIDAVSCSGQPTFTLPAHLPLGKNGEVPGWVSTMKWVTHFNFVAQDAFPMTEMVRDEGPGVLVTGTTDWTDYAIEAALSIHMADRAGLIARYQGLQRFLALVQEGNALRLIRQCYGRTVLAEVAHTWETDAFHTLRLACRGPQISAYRDGDLLFTVTESTLKNGGAGFYTEMGKIGYRAGCIEALEERVDS